MVFYPTSYIFRRFLQLINQLFWELYVFDNLWNQNRSAASLRHWQQSLSCLGLQESTPTASVLRTTANLFAIRNLGMCWILSSIFFFELSFQKLNSALGGSARHENLRYPLSKKFFTIFVRNDSTSEHHNIFGTLCL